MYLAFALVPDKIAMLRGESLARALRGAISSSRRR